MTLLLARALGLKANGTKPCATWHLPDTLARARRARSRTLARGVETGRPPPSAGTVPGSAPEIRVGLGQPQAHGTDMPAGEGDMRSGRHGGRPPGREGDHTTRGRWQGAIRSCCL